ncbi:dihydrodipicolinate synthase family protein [Pararhizobium sp. BT-229]|uniref:dihydrodipicolinate synthase family protein n=1 Tax=Pararhizobium sp. BT-229 TaxID=2986923 RepID=UPI0021F6B704|nr:dihydrodipicolinate synthase family protein [Pararhizobium sp. BT-229]MCV9963382.1 dihydrodipicolinate synthase family protein [Pararhizobium sp. BT-229]
MTFPVQRPDMLFHGLSAFPITPADPNGRVDTDALSALLKRIDKAGADSVGLLGSTGSYMYLSREEKRRAIEAAVDCLKGGAPVIVGVGALRTDQSVALAQDARDAGAEGLLLAPVSYTPLGDDEVFEHFATVAAATELPLCVYNNPGTTHFSIGPALLKRLADVLNIVAVKNPALPAAEMAAAHQVSRKALPAEFSIGYSGDWLAADAILAGGAAWYSVIAGLLPEPCARLMRAAQAGDRAETQRINSLFEPFWTLFRELSSYRVVHAAANLLDLSRFDPPRPILPLSQADRLRVQAALEALSAV